MQDEKLQLQVGSHADIARAWLTHVLSVMKQAAAEIFLKYRVTAVEPSQKLWKEEADALKAEIIFQAYR